MGFYSPHYGQDGDQDVEDLQQQMVKMMNMVVMVLTQRTGLVQRMTMFARLELSLSVSDILKWCRVTEPGLCLLSAAVLYKGDHCMSSFMWIEVFSNDKMK